MAGFIFAWLAWASVYLLFAGQLSVEEGIAAALCGLAAALWFLALRLHAAVRFRFTAQAWWTIFRAVAGLPSATAGVALVLIRSPFAKARGRVTAQLFSAGHRLDAEDAGRRAIVVLAISLAPDSFVLRTPEGRAEIDVHRLTPAPVRADDRWPSR